MGLLLTHKSTVRVFPDMVSVSIPGRGKLGKGGKRSDIQGFSKASRYRLFRLIHSLEFTRITFVTLTYGATYPDSGKSAKKDLRAFRRATDRRYGDLSAIWRMEYQERKAPHFHILYLDAPFIPVQDWCRLWDMARNAPPDEIFGNSLDLKINAKAKGSDVVSKYLGKYIAKPTYLDSESKPTNQGRLWGKWNVQEIQPVEMELYDYEARKLKTLLLPGNVEGQFSPLETTCYTVFGNSMGKLKFRNMVLSELEKLFQKTRKLERNRIPVHA